MVGRTDPAVRRAARRRRALAGAHPPGRRRRRPSGAARDSDRTACSPGQSARACLAAGTSTRAVPGSAGSVTVTKASTAAATASRSPVSPQAGQRWTRSARVLGTRAPQRQCWEHAVGRVAARPRPGPPPHRGRRGWRPGPRPPPGERAPAGRRWSRHRAGRPTATPRPRRAAGSPRQADRDRAQPGRGPAGRQFLQLRHHPGRDPLVLTAAQGGRGAAGARDAPGGSAEDQGHDHLVDDHPVRDAGAVTAERMDRLAGGEEGAELRPDGLGEGCWERGQGRPSAGMGRAFPT